MGDGSLLRPAAAAGVGAVRRTVGECERFAASKQTHWVI